ncbi:MAG: serine hydrolase [Ignavibacteria bacterium]
MKKHITPVLLVIFFLFCNNVYSNNGSRQLEEKLGNFLQWEEKFGFSGAVLVVKDGEIILSKGYGYSNKGMVLYNTPQTLFYIGSVSKPITALGIMKLAEEERINIYDPITKYFKDVPEDKAGINVQMLLTHTSGFEDTYSVDNISDRSLAIKTILNETPIIGAPGEKYNYSGDNYTLLAAIIEIVSGERYEAFITDNVLKPSGIDHLSFSGHLADLNIEEFASTSENSPYKSLKNIPATWGRKGRAGIILSVEDLYKLDKAITENKILSAVSIANVLSPKLKNEVGENYGLGFTIGVTSRDTKVFGHSGDDDGIGHNVVYLDFPEEDVKIFVASNSSNNGLYYGSSWSEVISPMLQRFLFKPDNNYANDRLFYNEFINYSSTNVEQFEGVYDAGQTQYHVWINSEDKLIVSPVGEPAAKEIGFSAAYSEKNSLANKILAQTSYDHYSLLRASSKDDATFEKTRTVMRSVWKSLKEKYGEPEKIEVLGTANIWSANYQSDIATWFKIYFKEGTKLYRLEWDANGKVTGLGGSRLPYPVMYTLNAIAKKEFIGFDAANGKTIAVNFLASDKGDNRSMMEINFGNKKTVQLSNSGKVELLPKRSAAKLFYNTILSEGINAAMIQAKEIENKLNRFNVSEDEINSAGYKLLKSDKFDEAIAMFTILVEAFPESANAFDSLGEGYMKAGNNPEAIRNYKKSLELDPKNENAKKMIEKLSE